MATVQGEEQKRIGELIRQQRKLKKMTQTELGALLNLGTKAISDYEKGHIKVIPFEKRVRLADMLDIQLTDLLYDEEKTDKFRISKDTFFKYCYESGIPISEAESGYLQYGELTEVEFKNEMLNACENLPFTCQILYVLRVTLESKYYSNNSNIISEILHELFLKHRKETTEFNLSDTEINDMIGCFMNLYFDLSISNLEKNRQ